MGVKNRHKKNLLLVIISFSVYFSILGGNSEDEKLFASWDQKGNGILSASICAYLEQRINPALILLTTLNLKDCLVTLPTAEQLGFRHPAIKNCIQKISEEKSFTPLRITWKSFLSHNLLQESLFVREFLLTLIILFSYTPYTLKGSIDNLEQSFLIPEERPKPQGPVGNKPTLQDIVDLYYTMQALPILQLLATLDALVVQGNEFLHAYELHSAISWSQWFARYWWVPPVILLGLVRILIKKLTSHPHMHMHVYRLRL